jgi:ParB-like chromosome segregation protein Spo0J
MDNVLQLIEHIGKIVDADERIQAIMDLKRKLSEIDPLSSQPVSSVKWVKIEKVTPNDYNPNAVAKKEMELLYISIKHDGYTQPIVTIYDEENDRYVIVDGFHRYYVCKTCADILERNYGYVPIVVIDKPISDRMASTVRHNRARGVHSIDGMANIVFNMLNEGLSDADICNELGMEAEELVKLKHITGFSKLFENAEYNKAWKTQTQIKIEKEQRNNAQNNNP